MLFTLVHDNKKYDYYKFVLNKKGILVYFNSGMWKEGGNTLILTLSVSILSPILLHPFQLYYPKPYKTDRMHRSSKGLTIYG